MQLTEKYRPKRLSQVVGQDKAISTIRRVLDRPGFDRGALWIAGPTGTGKTAIAGAIARRLGCDQWTVEELDGDKCSVERVRKLADNIGLCGWGGSPWRVYIVNEAHAMTSRAVQAWLTLLEKLPAHRLVIFTTTEDDEALFGQFTQPFMDRAITISLTKQGLSPKFARLARGIAQREGLNGQELASYQRLAQNCHNSMRAMLQAVERGDMMTS